MKGVFNLWPPLPRYTVTWDVASVLDTLRSLHPLHELPLKTLILKLVTLMALTQAARVQTLHILVLTDFFMGEDSCSVQLRGSIKQCRPKHNIRRVQFVAYPKDPRVCVLITL